MMYSIFAMIFAVLGFLVLQCESEVSDGSVYRPRLEAVIILVGALSLILSC